ncbi:peroxisomal acyl-coenzyme A oxidase 3 [Octodon degus]|uniref:Acyl-coenzyme A oxidase n=1 Tax=Octodon degus TaxID=10160 RepID=A0A6P6D7Q6_OCTDE|nr:peroxisomal acyl-coenzyme A oxidase 3 [Octodon degus]XP_023555685.1 peroxisomal acyl-coenzyme A oxidase 3 [Octodon degus]XP_023555686.1 peroxisomal acyl-coenzyme A oxidase 3 [Octodon degus]XP_023555688.1 peroxisomal acyl-coenzyme A oxidase 3 [Octodon degus]XP_023555694.1 peroxisomal acyl-coenzyme A oxidase 3 [Octodon degus]XP_023555696.1 peroxisomal acyl-coenzyme A oxidase 3 [Octodon degus]
MAPTPGGGNDGLWSDPPRGPLDAYRARASFSPRELQLFWEGEDTLRFKKAVFSALEKDPLFAGSRGADLSLEKYRELSFLRCKRVFEYGFFSLDNLDQSLLRLPALTYCLGMYDWSVGTKFALHLMVFGSALYSLGSERHLKYVEKVLNMEIFGCFALTELSHGSNTQAIRTTAHYDPTTEEFIIHSPDFEAAKFWVGNMGKTATHGVVFAQLYTPDGRCHGLHSFVVQIRDPKTLLPMPGVMVGDMGRKLGQNGLDSGFAMFHKVRIPRQDLLNRAGDVTPQGTYTATFKDARQRTRVSLGSLSSGRIFITGVCVVNLQQAVCIAIRFSATRRQFGPAGEEEIPVLEYQMQQWRLLPYLAAAYVLDHFSKSLLLDLARLYGGLLRGDQAAPQAELSREIHALAAAAKPLVSWTAQQGIQECREACGGHGYLAVNRLGDLRNDNDPNCTYEGDNSILLKEASKYLLNFLEPEEQDGVRFQSPLQTVSFLEAYPVVLGQRFQGTSVADWLDPTAPLAAYTWLVCYLLQSSHQKVSQERRSGRSDFEVKNSSQVYHLRTLALAFMERTVVQRFHTHVRSPSVPPSLRAVLGRLSTLYALWSLSQHTALLYRGGYLAGEQAGQALEAAILDLCAQLKDDAVALVDVIAPPDFVLNSPIGRADGELSKNLWGAVLQESGVLERASWWQEFSVHRPVVGSLKSKL